MEKLELLALLAYKSEWGEDQSEIREALAELYRKGRLTKAKVDIPRFVAN